MSNIYLSYFKSSKEFCDVFYLLLLQGVNYILPLALVPYLMIVLGAERYGYLGFSQAFIQYFILFIDFGFNLSATKRIAVAKKEGKQKLSKIFFSTLYAKILLFSIATILFLVLSFQILAIRKYLITMLCVYPMTIGTTLTFSWFYQGIGKIKIISLINTGSKLFILPLTFLLVKNVDDYNIAAVIQSSVFVISGIIAVFYLIKMNILSYSKVSYNDIKVEIKESVPLFLSSVATSMYTQLFTIILGLSASANVVGKYSAAERIMRSLCFVLYTPISQAFYPKIASLANINRQEALILFKRLFYIVGGIMVGVFLILFFCSNLVSHFLGKGYQGISMLLKIMSFAPFAIGIGGLFGQMGLVAMGNRNTKRNFQTVYFIAAPVSLICVAVLTPIFQEIGAAISMLITEYLVFALMVYFYRKNCKCLF